MKTTILELQKKVFQNPSSVEPVKMDSINKEKSRDIRNDFYRKKNNFQIFCAPHAIVKFPEATWNEILIKSHPK